MSQPMILPYSASRFFGRSCTATAVYSYRLQYEQSTNAFVTTVALHFMKNGPRAH